MASDSTVAHYLGDDGEPIDLNIDERQEMESLRALLRACTGLLEKGD